MTREGSLSTVYRCQGPASATLSTPGQTSYTASLSPRCSPRVRRRPSRDSWETRALGGGLCGRPTAASSSRASMPGQSLSRLAIEQKNFVVPCSPAITALTSDQLCQSQPSHFYGAPMI